MLLPILDWFVIGLGDCSVHLDGCLSCLFWPVNPCHNFVLSCGPKCNTSPWVWFYVDLWKYYLIVSVKVIRHPGNNKHIAQAPTGPKTFWIFCIPLVPTELYLEECYLPMSMSSQLDMLQCALQLLSPVESGTGLLGRLILPRSPGTRMKNGIGSFPSGGCCIQTHCYNIGWGWLPDKWLLPTHLRGVHLLGPGVNT